MKKLLLTAATVVPFLISCGGPEFSVGYRYVPPKDNTACLQSCDSEFSKCQQQCEERREKCIEDARKRAEAIYQRELSIYQKELSAYNKAYTSYQRALLDWNNNYRKLYKDYLYFKKACKKTKDYYACDRKYQLEQALDTLNDTKPTPPAQPQKPDLQKIILELSSSCTTDCGCKETYNACFTSCGGEIVPYKFCTKNCK